MFLCLSFEIKLQVSFYTASSHLLCFPTCAQLCCIFSWYKHFLPVPKLPVYQEWKIYGQDKMHGTSVAKQVTGNLLCYKYKNFCYAFSFICDFLILFCFGFFCWCTDSPALFLHCCVTLKPGVKGNWRD